MCFTTCSPCSLPSRPGRRRPSDVVAGAVCRIIQSGHEPIRVGGVPAVVLVLHLSTPFCARLRASLWLVPPHSRTFMICVEYGIFKTVCQVLVRLFSTNYWRRPELNLRPYELQNCYSPTKTLCVF